MDKKESRELIELIDPYHFWPPLKNIPKGKPISFIKFVGFLALRLYSALRNYGFKWPLQFIPIGQPVVIAAHTINEKAAIDDLAIQFTENVFYYSVYDKTSEYAPKNGQYNLFALRYSSKIIKWYFNLNNRSRDVYRRSFQSLFLSLGWYGYMLNSFRKSSQMNYYFGTNDHRGHCQIGFVAAKNAGKETIYLQHASVRESFPPLMVDYALLEGADAKNKYKSAGESETEVYLVGSVKFDSYLSQIDQRPAGKHIGVCVGSAFINLDEVFALCKEFHATKREFKVRFHPSVQNGVRKRFKNQNWKVSNPEHEAALDFIMDCHTVISGDSNILLETLVLKRRPVYFASDGVERDYYGFLARGLLDRCYLSRTELIESLSKTFNIFKHRKKAKYYHATLYTSYEGKSTELVLQILSQLISKNYPTKSTL